MFLVDLTLELVLVINRGVLFEQNQNTCLIWRYCCILASVMLYSLTCFQFRNHMETQNGHGVTLVTCIVYCIVLLLCYVSLCFMSSEDLSIFVSDMYLPYPCVVLNLYGRLQLGIMNNYIIQYRSAHITVRRILAFIHFMLCYFSNSLGFRI